MESRAVLVVEHEAAVGAAVGCLVRSAGYETVSAASSQQPLLVMPTLGEIDLAYRQALRAVEA